MTDLAVAEVFGPTVQGEGPSLGRRCSFIRLARCNLSCSWCDTPFTWDWSGKNGTKYDPAVEVKKMTTTEAIDLVRSHGTNRLIITGGEPTLQQSALIELATLARYHGMWVEVETNGTRSPEAMLDVVDQWNVSPKLSNSGEPIDRRLNWPALELFAKQPDAYFKFVCQSVDDLEEVADIVAIARVKPSQVYIMPEGTRSDDVTGRQRVLTDEAIDRGYNVTTRLHVLTWGNKRGV